MLRFTPVFLMHLKISRRLVISCSGEFMAIPMSLTYCSQWFALITQSKYSRESLENADRDLPRPCASLWCAKVLLVKFSEHCNGVLGMQRYACAQWYAWER